MRIKDFIEKILKDKSNIGKKRLILKVRATVIKAKDINN